MDMNGNSYANPGLVAFLKEARLGLGWQRESGEIVAYTYADAQAGEWLRTFTAPYRTEENKDYYDEAFRLYYTSLYNFSNFGLMKELVEEGVAAYRSPKNVYEWTEREVAGFYITMGCEQVEADNQHHPKTEAANLLIRQAKYGDN